MAAGVINLNKARKTKARQDKERQAAVNRAVHGLTKEERETFERTKSLEQSRLAAHELKPAGPDSTGTKK